MNAYWLAVERCTLAEVYNIGSGVAREVREMLDIFLNMTDAKIDIEVHPSRLRPSDPDTLLCDATKFQKVTGWQPKIPF